jgi:phosphoglycerol transferase
MHERMRVGSHVVSTYAVATVLCLLAVVIQFRLWRADFHVPFYYDLGGDVDYNMALVKTLRDTGWLLTNPWLGAPYIQENYDLQQGDNLPFLLIKLIADVTPDFGTAINISFLLGFVLTTWTSLFVLRTLSISNPIAIAVSLLYAFQPYHFARGQLHLALSFYFAVPLIAMAILWFSDGRSVFSAQDEQGRTRLGWRRGKTLPALLACLLIGSSGAYYALFATMLVFAAGLIALLRSWKVARLVDPLVATLLICGFFALNLAPTFWYARAHGKNPETAVRYAHESLTDPFSGLSLTELMKSVPYPTVKGLAAKLVGREHPVPGARDVIQLSVSLHERAPLGLAGTCGFLALLLTLFLSRRPRGDLRILAPLSRLNLAALLVVWQGGLGYLFALWVSPKIRAWNRMSIFVAFFALMAVAILLQHIRQHWIKTSGAAWLFQGALAAILVFGVFEQMSQTWVPNHAAARGEFEDEQDVVRKIEAALPENALVFQLPYVPFPEGVSAHDPDRKVSCYIYLKPYLHSRRIHWSSGAMKGRDTARWQQSVAEEPASKLVPDLIAKGFKGLWIDRRGYRDETDVKLIADLRAILHVEPIVDKDGNIVFFFLPGNEQDIGGSH